MVFVTGGTGLLGARLIYDLVKSGEEVVALKRSTSDLSVVEGIFDHFEKEDGRAKFEKVKWHEGDVTDVPSLLEVLQEGDEVYHCAAMVSFNPKAKTKMMKVNIEGTANLVNACIEKKVRKLCFASSVAAIGKPEVGQEISEETKWKTSEGKSNYSISKYNSEKEVWRGIEEGLDAVMVNPTIILGPGNWRKSSARMFLDVWRGLKYYTAGVNGFVDVRDVTGAMIKLMKSDISAERFIVSSENVAFKEVFDRIAEGLGKEKPTFEITPFYSEIFWRLDKFNSTVFGAKSRISKEIARESQGKAYYSVKKLKEALGMELIPIAQSISDTAEIFLKQHK
ncbi:MAG: NAD-dependent epimerase/dehydratase family protein [Flavobacteriales bacterium]|nr:NAD-dependent epimerase/dehydratase family protein [Flavobacteriales bacterium]